MGTEPKKKEPRHWLVSPSAFGTSRDVEFCDEPGSVGDRADWLAARLQNDAVSRAAVLRHGVGFSSWSGLARAHGPALGMSEWQLRSVVRGQTWMRLPLATALGEICGEPLIATSVAANELRIEMERLRAELEAVKNERARLLMAHADLRRKLGSR